VKILLVDDEQRLLDALVTAFHFRWPEAEVITATDADSGLWLALGCNPDAVVLDIGLPDRSGLDVLTEIRRSSDVPVILLTAAREEMDHVRGLELGADDYLGKPFGNMALLSHVKAVLRRAQPLRGPGCQAELAAGGLRLHELSREIVGSSCRVRLTPIEFRLLYFLMRNAGHVVSRSSLIRRVWGTENGATDHDLSVFVARVRAKIAHAGEKATIIAEHGLGYRLISA
jgi:DNA-binding response OmpR family regulator